ncbi:hypothetical protein LSAT2_017055 [Lamellibrachia satsuma]|nr:hypothetical protein LSAT2_017055 [Lamellibrachia satsuma]
MAESGDDVIEYGEWSACSKTCGGGLKSVNKLCGSDKWVCGSYEATCNNIPCTGMYEATCNNIPCTGRYEATCNNIPCTGMYEATCNNIPCTGRYEATCNNIPCTGMYEATCNNIPCTSRYEATCNNIPCIDPQEGSTWSECSKSCGEGVKQLVDADGNVIETIPCNTQRCIPAGQRVGEGLCNVNVIILVDSSASVGQQNWENIRQFTISVINALTPNNVGVVRYSSGAQVVAQLGDSATAAIQAVSQMVYDGSSTLTYFGIDKMREMIKAYKANNPGANNFVGVLLSDGPTVTANPGNSEAVAAANALKEDGVSFVGIAFPQDGGDLVDNEELKNIVSQAALPVIKAQTYDALNALVDDAVANVCRVA